MKPILLTATLAFLACSVSKCAADSVELNGITCLPGEKLACLLLYQTSRQQPLNFTLAEGASRFGYKLIEVDAGGRRVLVEHDGSKHYVRICSPPELIAPASDGSSKSVADRPAQTDEQAVFNFLGSEEAARIQAGNPLWPGVLIGAGNRPGSSGNSAAGDGGQNNSGANNGTTDLPDNGPSGQTTSSAGQNQAKTPAREPWYQESLNIERARIANAAAVVVGNMEPFPRTPLTPPGTPAALVGHEVFFSNQIPGFQFSPSLVW